MGRMGRRGRNDKKRGDWDSTRTCLLPWGSMPPRPKLTWRQLRNPGILCGIYVQNVATRISRRSGFAWRFITSSLEAPTSAPAPASQPVSDSSWSADARKAASDRLLNYFGKTAPQLLRPAEGILCASEHCLQPSGQGLFHQPLGLGHLLDDARPLPLRYNFK